MHRTLTRRQLAVFFRQSVVFHLRHLNPQQRQAVEFHDGPMLVLAGAGSGKTGVIANKIAYLIDAKKIDAPSVFAITFTNKAAREMRSRVSTLLGKREARPWISTFHTLGLRILRAEYELLGYRRGFSILDAGDCAALLADLMRRDSPGTDIAVAAVQAAISAWKYALTPPGTIPLEGMSAAEALAARCYGPYREALMTYNAVDFDDLISGPVQILKENEDVRSRWQSQVTHLLVDEYQDTNLSQYALIRLLVEPGQRLTVVGDDDQSIYAWRGARPENIAQLSKDFPDLKVIKLEQNYRCSGTILNAANALIANNPHPFPKTLWSAHGFGDRIRVFSCSAEHDETERIANDILHRRLLGKGGFADFAVLIRSNHQARLFEHAFREREIRYVLSGGRSFFDYAEIRDCVAYLRLLANPEDNNALLRIVNTPRRAIGTQTVKQLVETSSEIGFSLLATAQSLAFSERVSQQVYKRVSEFAAWLTSLHEMSLTEPAPDVFATLLRDVDYDSWLAQTSDGEAAATRRQENVRELQQWVARIHAVDESRGLSDVVAALTLFDIAERQESENETDGVALATLHAAKGLEYTHVYLAGFEENLLPHRSSVEQDQVEEERRLAYVGITRAKQTLTLSFCRARKRFGQIEPCEPSRFLNELPRDELVWDGAPVDEQARRSTGRGTLDSLKQMLKT